MIKKIAFIGATGMLGKPVAMQLVKAGFSVRALVRNPEKARKELAGVELMQGDLKNISDLENLLKNQDAVYVSLSVTQDEREKDWHAETDGMRNILTAAKNIRLQRILLLSSLVQRYQGMNHFNWWVFNIKEESIAMVKKSGLPYTVFYPSTFMESFLGKYKQGKRILLAGTSQYPMYYIAAEDYGRQVAQSLTIDGNQEYVIQGPDPLTQEQAAAIFLANYKKEKLTLSKLPLGILKFFGLFSGTANYGAHIVEALNLYPEKFESDDAWRKLGKPTITMKQFSETA